MNALPASSELTPLDDFTQYSPGDLEKLICSAIDDSAMAWNHFIDTNSAPVIKNGSRIRVPLVMKYVPTNRAKNYLPAPGRPPFATPNDLFNKAIRSPTPNFFIGDNFYTWGRAVYVVGISEPLSTAIYGRVGLVAALDLTKPWKAFDVRDPVKARLYLEWLRRQDTYPVAALTFDSVHWLHLLRNKFRTDFEIHVVMCHPDEQDTRGWYTGEIDTWLCVSDFETDTDKPAGAVKLVDQDYSARFCDVRLVVVGEEEFLTDASRKAPRAPGPPPARVPELVVSGARPPAPQMHDIADAYWQARIVRVGS